MNCILNKMSTSSLGARSQVNTTMSFVVVCIEKLVLAITKIITQKLFLFKKKNWRNHKRYV
jgi:hypothetical protein